MNPSLRLIIAVVLATVYAEALVWLRYKGKGSRFVIALAKGVGISAILTWLDREGKGMFIFWLCLWLPVSIIGLSIGESFWPHSARETNPESKEEKKDDS